MEAQSSLQPLPLRGLLPALLSGPAQHSADAQGGWGRLLLGSRGKLSFGSLLCCTSSLLNVLLVTSLPLQLALISEGNSFSLLKEPRRLLFGYQLNTLHLCLGVQRMGENKASEGEPRAWGEASMCRARAGAAWLCWSTEGARSLHVALICLGNEICLDVLNTITAAALKASLYSLISNLLNSLEQLN